MRTVCVLFLLGVIPALAACDAGSVTAPAVPSPAPSFGPAPEEPPRPAVGLTNVSVQTSVDPKSGYYFYAVSAALQETSGVGGALVTSVRVESPQSLWGPGMTMWEEAGEGCWRRAIRLEPGGTLDVFEALGYCAPGMAAPIPLPYLVLSVGFIDDAGRPGGATARIDIIE